MLSLWARLTRTNIRLLLGVTLVLCIKQMNLPYILFPICVQNQWVPLTLLPKTNAFANSVRKSPWGGAFTFTPDFENGYIGAAYVKGYGEWI